MPKLKSPTGETVYATRAGAKLLIPRGYTDPNQPTEKKRVGKKTDDNADTPEPEREDE